MSSESPKEHHEISQIEQPPTSIVGIMGRLGPGLIIAGSIVGSGELIATTKTGAEAGFLLLWLILIGCVIKVFVQVEMGRYTLFTGNTAMDGLAEVPGPNLKGRGNWLTWYWMLVFLATVGQVGGIVGGVGQALQISVPITDAGRQFNKQVDVETEYQVTFAELRLANARAEQGEETARSQITSLQQRLDELGPQVIDNRLEVLNQQRQDAGRSGAAGFEEAAAAFEAQIAQHGKRPDLVLFDPDNSTVAALSEDARQAYPSLGRLSANDDDIWAVIIAIITAAVLVVGRYKFIQSFSAILVASFTFITIVNLVMLQNNEYWSVRPEEFVAGLSFKLPNTGIGTALATFGIIGVGANELISYPYWCLEKGYARFTGPHSESEDWAARARGWMRVMRWDAWCSMLVYTLATTAFYLLGAAILWRTNLNPEKDEMIRTLGVMYEPVFGQIASLIFLFGAFAVLYSTFFVATASLARVVPDALRVMGLGPKTDASYQKWIKGFSVAFPFSCVLAYTTFKQPAALVLIGGVMQGIMLPMLAAAALYFRYYRSDKRIAPTKLWDLFLWLSAVGMLITGLWTVWDKITS